MASIAIHLRSWFASATVPPAVGHNPREIPTTNHEGRPLGLLAVRHVHQPGALRRCARVLLHEPRELTKVGMRVPLLGSVHQVRPVDVPDADLSVAHAQLHRDVVEHLLRRRGGDREAHGALRDLDEVAFLRFASVYQAFDSLEDFEAAIDQLRLDHPDRHSRPGVDQSAEG